MTDLGGRRSSTDTNAGSLAAAAWLSARGLKPSKKWEIEVGLSTSSSPATTDFDPKHDTRLQLLICAQEWGLRFCHAGRESWIRITDIPFVHGTDAFNLLGGTPPLKNLSAFVRALEAEHGIKFQRSQVTISSTIAGAEPAVRRWVLSL